MKKTFSVLYVRETVIDYYLLEHVIHLLERKPGARNLIDATLDAYLVSTFFTVMIVH